ncbi:MAG: hypothetical protein P1U64_13170 [Alcanivoracaceae bacterium]|nr:hypothetical protein [Alcanivoracaceae bacterium]
MKNVAIFMGAILIGIFVYYSSTATIGLLAAYTPHHPVFYKLTIPVPQVIFSAIGALLLFMVVKSKKWPYVVAYLSAVTTFILAMKPWVEFMPGVRIGFLGLWDTYLSFFALIVLGWFLANKAKQAGTP